MPARHIHVLQDVPGERQKDVWLYKHINICADIRTDIQIQLCVNGHTDIQPDTRIPKNSIVSVQQNMSTPNGMILCLFNAKFVLLKGLENIR